MHFSTLFSALALSLLPLSFALTHTAGSYTNGLEINQKAYNVACHGNCCAYYANGFRTQPNFDSDSIRSRAASLLGCGDSDKNSINGLQVTPVDGSGVCLSDGNGCGDCFDGECLGALLLRAEN